MKRRYLGTLRPSGYYIVATSFRNKYYSACVHELVAHMYVPNPNKLPYVRHKDGNIQNNKASNLEWSKYNENTRAEFKAGILRHCKVKATRPGATHIFKSVKEAALWVGSSKAEKPIRKCCRGEIKQAFGYKWEVYRD